MTTPDRTERRVARDRTERGAAAVEFALLTPLLLALVLGAVEYGDRYGEAQEYNNAALIAARSVAIKNDESSARSSALAASVRSGSTVSFSYTRGSCALQADGSYGDVTVTVSKTGIASVTPLPSLLPGVPNTWGVSGKAVFRCGG